jgi:tetratricopeptide (TPR) repeat protein
MTKLVLHARLFACAFAVSLAGLAIDASADDIATAAHDAGKHFERGVALYRETDYLAALVEFKRAYALSPNSAVLYNIGEAEYQLQDYANALVTFTRYLTEAPPGSSHRVEVENDVEVLQARVGHLGIVTVPPGADVSVDDQPAGKTPLNDRLLVSVGHRKVTAVYPGRTPVTRFVDVAADDDVSVTLELAATAPATVPSRGALGGPEPTADRPPSRNRATLQTVGWISTGLLATGAAVAGVFALKESAALNDTRATFPVSAGTLQSESDRTRTYSILADSLTAAAVAAGGVTLFWTLTSHGAAHATEGAAARLRLTPTWAGFEGTF